MGRQMGDSSYPWALDAQFLIATITVLYYSYILFITMRSKSESFKSPFFIIFRFTGIFSIIGNLAVEWARNDRNSGFEPTIEPFTRVMYTMTGITLFTHLIRSLLMTTNRFTAVCLPWAYGKIWTRRNVYIMLLADVVVFVAVHIQLFFISFIYERGSNGWKVLGREVQIPVVRAISSSATIIYGCISVALISRTIYITLKVSKKSKGHQKTGLVVFVAIDCFLSLVDCIYEAADLLGLSNANVVFVWINKNVTILMFLILSINAFSITFLSKELRMESVAPCRRKERSTAFTATIVMSIPSTIVR